MEIGIDSFASAMYGSDKLSSVDAMEQVLDRIIMADKAGLDFLVLESITRMAFWIQLLL